jgi:hypothetical protein
MNAYIFIFVEWMALLVSGYYIIIKERYSFSEAVTKAWYQTFIGSMAIGAVSLRILNSIRLWYWDEIYEEIELERRREIMAQAAENGDPFFENYDDTANNELNDGTGTQNSHSSGN